jgi:hypothetical protein
MVERLPLKCIIRPGDCTMSGVADLAEVTTEGLEP